MEIQKEKLHKRAIDAALSSNWKKAIEINMKIIKIDPRYIDSYLGIGYAYLKECDMKNAKKYYREALKLDPNNTIALNNIDKINILSKKGESLERVKSKNARLDPSTFINIRGKTKNITLLNTGQPSILAKLNVGDKVFLSIKKRRIELRNSNNEYIGALPDDMSKRLIFFINSKSKYSTFIKSVCKNSVEIFIREDKKGSKVKHYVSFPANIQDDLKLFIGKSEDEADEFQDEDSSEKDENDDEVLVNDPEEMANEENDEKEDLFSDVSTHDDDFDE